MTLKETTTVVFVRIENGDFSFVLSLNKQTRGLFSQEHFIVYKSFIRLLSFSRVSARTASATVLFNMNIIPV